jgi:hypothetical protein
MPSDFPKLESPFVRKIDVNGNYTVVEEVSPGYEWVFNDPTVKAVEKLHGTNVSVVIENGVVSSIWNRTGRVPFFNKGKNFIVQGLLESYERGYLDLEDGQHFGELVGPKLHGNPYGLKEHLWLPFKTYSWNRLAYTSWGKYPKDFASVCEWIGSNLMPLFSLRMNGKDFPNPFVEGVVFTHPDGRMAKLRKDMLKDFTGIRHKGYSPE